MWNEILRVARRNIIYELAVTCVFMVTLVSCQTRHWNIRRDVTCDIVLVCLSRHHNIDCPVKSRSTPTSFHFTALRCL
jgi:hypothetical protein